MRFEPAALLLAALLAHAQPIPEFDMKAAYIFNFAVFTEWPQASLAQGAPISFCINSSNGMHAAVSTLNDKPLNGHKITVRSIPASARGCHVLVLGSADRERWPQLKRELAGGHVLTVTDDRSIGGDGAVIGMSLENQRIGFDVDLGAARGAQLSLSSKLLRLARSVQ